MVPGAEEQSTTFKVRVDTQKPVITSGYIRFKDGAQQFVARKAKDVGDGGILTEKLVYVTPFDDQGTMVQTSEDKNSTRALENYHVIKANADGSFDLPENIDKKNIYYYVEDFAGNVDYVSLADLVRDQNSGRVQIAVRNAKTNKDLDTMYVYRIKDSNGQYVSVDKTKDINFLNFGHYTAEIFTYDRTEVKFVSSLTQEFDLTEDNSFQTIAFLDNTLEYAPVSISCDQPVSKAATIVLKGADGGNFVLPAEKYGKNGFGKSVATGQYTLVATLPTGYELAEEAPVISVVAGRNNNYRIGVISKVDLLAALNNQAVVTKTAHYFNASADKKEAYDQALQAAQAALTNKVSQEQVNQALASLEAASQALDGKDSNVAALKEAMQAYDATTKTGRYANAKEKVRRDYDRAFQTVALLAVDQTVKQEQINQALAELSRAEGKLNGKATDFSSLEKYIKEELKFQEKNAKFIYAGNEEKEAYLAAFKDAQTILSNPGASQQDVKDALTALKNAKKKLHGKKPKAARRP